MKSIDILRETDTGTIYKYLGDYKVKVLDVTFALERLFSIRVLSYLKNHVKENIKGDVKENVKNI